MKLPISQTNSVAFVPRDAGFFSVFNFLIGSIHKQLFVYPIFNKSLFEQFNSGKPQHFCYWGNSENSWFDYFELIEYYPNDITHISKELNYLPIINGADIADKEFTHPNDTKKLFTDLNKFSDWRQDIHQIYQKYIHIKQHIIDKAHNILNNINKPIIGIHYRHPSHTIESGFIYLQNYFDKIDQILINQPQAGIFVASDTMFGILAFKERYKDRVTYIDSVDRLDLDNILQWAFALIRHNNIDAVGFINKKGYELQHKQAESATIDSKKLTEDLLLETICLSKCDYLIHGISNIALAISYINPNISMLTLIP